MHVHYERKAGSWSYRCRSAARGPGCVTGEISSWAVDPVIDEAIVERLTDSAWLAEVIQSLSAQTDNASLDPTQMAGSIKTLGDERARVVTSYERGFRTLTETEDRLREIDRDVARLKAALRELGQKESTEPNEAALLIAETFASWGFLSRSDKRQILASAVEGVEVERTGRAKARVAAISLRRPA